MGRHCDASLNLSYFEETRYDTWGPKSEESDNVRNTRFFEITTHFRKG